jgi:DNA invertase Pin-like site-specific DNA recombinase
MSGEVIRSSKQTAQRYERERPGELVHMGRQAARQDPEWSVANSAPEGADMRDTLNLIHDLAERGIGVRKPRRPLSESTPPTQRPMAQLAVVLLALFGQMERTYTLERAAHARAVATAKGRRIGRPPVVDPNKIAYAAHLRDTGHSIADIVAKTGIARTSLYRHLPPRPTERLTTAGAHAKP